MIHRRRNRALLRAATELAPSAVHIASHELDEIPLYDERRYRGCWRPADSWHATRAETRGRDRLPSRATGSRRSSPYRLAEAQQVPLAVSEPGASLADALARVVSLDCGDAIHSLQARQVVLFEDDAASPERRDSRLDSATSHAICVCVPDAAPADSNRAKEPLPQRYRSPPGLCSMGSKSSFSE